MSSILGATLVMSQTIMHVEAGELPIVMTNFNFVSFALVP